MLFRSPAENAQHDHNKGTLTADSAGSEHPHGVPYSSGGGSGGENTSRWTDVDGGTFNTSIDGAHPHTISGKTATSGSGTAHNNMQPTAFLNLMIKL